MTISWVDRTSVNGIAGGGANTPRSGFRDGSDAGLIQHVASCNIPFPAGVPFPAGKGQKPSWGLGGEAPDVSALGAAGSTSLDEIQTNRDRNPGWKKNCGRYSVRGESSKEPGKFRYCRVGCKCWGCVGCGPRRASMFCIRIAETAERLRLNKLLTLTLDPAKLQGQESTRYINEVFADFRVYLRRKLGRAPSYIRVLEYQKNGNAHLHILVNCWLDQSWVSEAWAAVGGGRIVDIRMVDMRRISHYLSKYLTKQMLECAPPRARRVTTSRDIKLLQSDYAGDFSAWVMMRAPLAVILDKCEGRVTSRVADADGYLMAFEAFLSEPSLETIRAGSNVRSALFAEHVFSLPRTGAGSVN